MTSQVRAYILKVPLRPAHGGSLDPERRRALCEFYREEFIRHIEHLASSGVVPSANRDALDNAYRKFLDDLEEVCWRDDFPAVAEALLQHFDTLTRLSELDSRRCH